MKKKRGGIQRREKKAMRDEREKKREKRRLKNKKPSVTFGNVTNITKW
jgi:hypothetical protein